MSATRSEKYYYDTVVFEVEGTLYRVYRHAFLHWSQSVFRDMFSLPQGVPGSREGDKDENPIKLTGCTKAEFESLLEIFDPSNSLVLPISKQQWIDVLKLARLWDMPKIATAAIEKLSAANLSPAEKVYLGQAYGVPNWLKEGLCEVLNDLPYLTLDDMKLIGWETACRVMAVRNEAPTTTGVWVPWKDLRCLKCAKNGYGGELLDDRAWRCRRCGLVPGGQKGWGCCIHKSSLALPGSHTRPAPEEVEDEGHDINTVLLETFAEEIEHAERRNVS